MLKKRPSSLKSNRRAAEWRRRWYGHASKPWICGDRFPVYDRQDEPCSKKNCIGTIRRREQGGRSTFYCPVCQR